MRENTIKLNASLFIGKEEGTKEDFFDQFYNTHKFRRWFSVFPIVWVKFDKKHLEEGCVGRLYFTMPPFTYKMICRQVIPNERIEMEVTGLLKGKITAIFCEQPDGTFMDHPLEVTGKNIFVHFYYRLFLSKNHLPFMNWRYKTLKRNLLKGKKDRKRDM